MLRALPCLAVVLLLAACGTEAPTPIQPAPTMAPSLGDFPANTRAAAPPTLAPTVATKPPAPPTHPPTKPPVPPTPVPPSPTAIPVSLEYQLATINAGGYVAPDDLTVTRFRFLLLNLSAATGATRQQVADLTVNGQTLLRTQYGKSITLLDLMEAEYQAAQSSGDMPMDQLSALVVVYLGRQ